MAAMQRSTVAGLAVNRYRPTPPDGPGPLGAADTADQPVVVVVHGALDRASSLGRLCRQLPELDVVAYDRRGYGRSLGLGVATGLDDHVDDLEAIVHDLGRPVVLVGHSFGGLVVMDAAARLGDRVQGTLTYESPAHWLANHRMQPYTREILDQPDPGVAAEEFMRRVVGDDAWERLPPSTKAARRAEGGALLADLRALPQDGPPFDPEAVTARMVVAYGGASEDRLRRAATDMAAAFPHARVAVVPGAEHPVHLTHPRELAALVRSVLATVGDGVVDPIEGAA